MMRRRVVWLLKRLAATAALIYGLNFVAFIAAVLTVWASLGWAEGAPAPAWLNRWGAVGVAAPLGVLMLAGLIWAVVKLVQYWRAS